MPNTTNIEKLVALLRNPPKDFTWDFRHHKTCALGLAGRLWPESICPDLEAPNTERMVELLDITDHDAVEIFIFGASDKPAENITAEDIAKALETRYL
ncbi:MAG: hypothetical protein GY906_23120 [bacterium]|nr:hypothetical protein [bacterium]